MNENEQPQGLINACMLALGYIVAKEGMEPHPVTGFVAQELKNAGVKSIYIDGLLSKYEVIGNER